MAPPVAAAAVGVKSEAVAGEWGRRWARPEGSAAAACLDRTQAGALDHCIAGHESAEQAHKAVLAQLGKTPLLALGLRLGEGSGAALAIQVLKGAIACHSGMATFAEAGVSDG